MSRVFKEGVLIASGFDSQDTQNTCQEVERDLAPCLGQDSEKFPEKILSLASLSYSGK